MSGRNRARTLFDSTRSPVGPVAACLNTHGADGAGGAVHLAAERIFRGAGVKARMIPYSDSGKILQSFLGDNIDVYGGVIGIKGTPEDRV